MKTRLWGSQGIVREMAIRVSWIALVGAAALSAGCASMGPPGATRYDAAKALGIAPSDVIILSRDYAMSGSGDGDLYLSQYTIKTSSDLTYTCTITNPTALPADGAKRQVCKPKD